MLKEINVVLGERIKAQRWKLNMTRENLAEKIDVSPRFLADVESGKTGVSLQTLKLLSLSLGVSSDYLLDIDKKEENYLLPLVRNLADIDKKYLPLLTVILSELKKV